MIENSYKHREVSYVWKLSPVDGGFAWESEIRIEGSPKGSGTASSEGKATGAAIDYAQKFIDAHLDGNSSGAFNVRTT